MIKFQKQKVILFLIILITFYTKKEDHMLRTNQDSIIKMAVQGKIVNPGGPGAHGVDADGNPILLPSVGGIVYNVKV